ncbi:hemerythrin domain-containing protein [Dactylosporangium sp. NPDC048998]|uniref:hemerythrin domain-containing protein n=1 Tax=Dactylosporangium sp. NPDC048998 TaxID=3363976 RepID=UPI00370F802C
MSHPETADETAAQAVRRHHAQLAAELDQRVEALLRLVDDDDPYTAEEARQDLLGHLRREIVPHALAEERALYPAAAAEPEGRLLVDGMLGEHRALTALIGELAATGSPVRAAAAGRALSALFAVHLAKENDLVLPLLVAAPGVSLAGILAGMHDLLGLPGPESVGAAQPAGGCGCGGCGCGGDQAGSPAS